MKSPDEIKTGLEICSCDDGRNKCVRCPYFDGTCQNDLNAIEKDALALIQHLERKNKCLQENKESFEKRMIDLAQRMPRWISVEENEKPRLRQDCLCICSYSDTKNHEWDYMMVLRWMGEGDNGYVNRPHFQHEGMNGMIVTHWMPLPEPPEG